MAAAAKKLVGNGESSAPDKDFEKCNSYILGVGLQIHTRTCICIAIQACICTYHTSGHSEMYTRMWMRKYIYDHMYICRHRMVVHPRFPELPNFRQLLEAVTEGLGSRRWISHVGHARPIAMSWSMEQ